MLVLLSRWVYHSDFGFPSLERSCFCGVLVFVSILPEGGARARKRKEERKGGTGLPGVDCVTL